MGPQHPNVPFLPCGQPGALVTTGAAESADGLVQGDYPVDESCQQSGLPIFGYQDLVQSLGTQHISLHAPRLVNHHAITSESEISASNAI